MDKIRRYFEELVEMDNKDWAIFSSFLIREEYLKKAFILEQGKVENYLSFIESGVVRLFVPKEENDLTFSFCFENQFVSAYDSFLTQAPCNYAIQALSNTALWRISYEDLQKVYQLTTVGNTIGRLAAENIFLTKAEREYSLLNETAEQRYLALFEKRPKLIKEIPLKYIAAFIGITPQALSRIRRRIS